MLLRQLIDFPMDTLFVALFLMLFVLFIVPLVHGKSRWARAMREWGRA